MCYSKNPFKSLILNARNLFYIKPSSFFRSSIKAREDILVLKICTNPPFTTIYHDFCTELINGFPRVTIEILMRDQLISYQRVRHLLWRSYATTPGLSTGPIWSEISTKIAFFSPKMLHLAFAPVILCRNF